MLEPEMKGAQRTMRKLRRFAAFAAVLGLLIPLLASIATSPAAAQNATPQVNTELSGELNVAMVANPQMKTLEKLLPEFKKLYPNVKVNLLVLPENEIRNRITTDVAGQSGQFDLVTIGMFEVPIWAKNGWLEEVGDDLAQDPSYGLDDIFPSMKSALSYEDKLYAAPFYGESSMMFYRKDLFQQAGLEMPEKPTWDQIADFAKKLHNAPNLYGICLRGLPGWGEQGAPLTSVIDAFGGRWFDMDWKAQLDSEKSSAAINFYIDLVKNYGEPSATQAGFTECENLFVQGKVAMWYDATSAADLISDPSQNQHSADVGFAYAPTKAISSPWLWSWAFALEKSSDHKDAAIAFMKWATSKDYVQLVAKQYGWGQVPAGVRASTYADQGYKEYASAFSDIVLNSIKAQNPTKCCVDDVPYTGLQFVQIPEFQDFGTSITQEFAAAMAGQETVDEAIKKANDIANQAVQDAGLQ
jgi:sorbitol/mannitol transport system substrate-binding protein